MPKGNPTNLLETMNSPSSNGEDKHMEVNKCSLKLPTYPKFYSRRAVVTNSLDATEQHHLGTQMEFFFEDTHDEGLRKTLRETQE